MNDKHVKKIRTLKLLEILRNETDEEHPMSTDQIIERIRSLGLFVERKTVYDDIECLNEAGYEIMQRRGRANYYYVADRNFDDAEIQMLLDAVYSANFITQKKTQDLASRLCALSGKKHGESLIAGCSVFEKEKHANEQIWYNVDALRQAIAGNKKVLFKYFNYDLNGEKIFRKKGGTYLVNPLGLVYSQDNYYLIAYGDKYSNVASYRVDRMVGVEISDQDINRPEWLNDFDISQYRLRTFSMYSGEEQQIAFVAEKEMVDVVFDKFGYDVKLNPLGDDKFTFRTKVGVSPTFFGWLASLNGKLIISSPKKIADAYLQFLTKSIEAYK